MENTPERQSLECFSSIKSASNQNISEIPNLSDSSEVQKSREEGFSSSILLNLAEESSRPASKLINITQIRPGNNPRKLLLPLFFQEFSEIQGNINQSISRPRRSLSMDSGSSLSYPRKQLVTDEKKTITTTTINTQSNLDVIEISPDLFKEAVKYEYETDLKNSGVNFEMPEFTTSPTIVFCNQCGTRNMTVVEIESTRGKLFEKIYGAFCCCVRVDLLGNDTFVHKCSKCLSVVFKMNA